MNDLDNFIDATALAVSDSFVSPEVFGVVAEQVSRECGIKESEAGSLMIACYGMTLWQDESWVEFGRDYIKSVLASANPANGSGE